MKLSPQLGGGYVPEVSYCPFPSCTGAPPTFTPTWWRISADSSHVVFTARAAAGSPRELFSAPLDGGPANTLGLPAGSDISDAFRISPDSGRVVYIAPGGSALHGVPIAGGSSVTLNGTLVPGGQVLDAAISPDSGRVAYIADEDANDVVELYSVPAAGGSSVKLDSAMTSGGDVQELRFGPDSSFVFYRADQVVDERVEVFRVRADGSRPERRVNGPLTANGDVSSSWSLSPDGRHVVYVADERRDGVDELFASPLFVRLSSAELGQ